MVAPIPPGDTTQWDVLAWVISQAKFMTATQHHVLLYLAASSFYQADNPEQAAVGQVLRQASYVDAIVDGTSLKRDAIRQAMKALQSTGYIQREVREDQGIHGQQPHLIYVLWDYDRLREGLRDGSLKLPQELLSVPSRPAKRVRLDRIHSAIRSYTGYDEVASHTDKGFYKG